MPVLGGLVACIAIEHPVLRAESRSGLGRRDLKLDNTLMSDDRPPRIKLCDFGFAKEWQSDAQMFTHIGCVQPQLPLAPCLL